jgi:hypothetical protein
MEEVSRFECGKLEGEDKLSILLMERNIEGSPLRNEWDKLDAIS